MDLDPETTSTSSDVEFVGHGSDNTNSGTMSSQPTPPEAADTADAPEAEAELEQPEQNDHTMLGEADAGPDGRPPSPTPSLGSLASIARDLERQLFGDSSDSEPDAAETSPPPPAALLCGYPMSFS